MGGRGVISLNKIWGEGYEYTETMRCMNTLNIWGEGKFWFSSGEGIRKRK